MAVYQDSKISPRVWLAGLGVCAVAGLGFWWWSGSTGETSGAAESLTAASAAASGGAAMWASAGSGMPTQVPEANVPEVAPDALAILKAAMAKQPNAAGEAERVVSYLNYQHRFEYWQSLEGSRNVQQRHQLAESLLQELPARLAKGEFSMPEAVMMVSVLLADLESDEPKRDQRLQEWQGKLLTVAPQPAEFDEQWMMEKQRLTEAKRGQAVAFAEWQALPAEQRTQAKLEEALEAARRLAYGASPQ